MYVAIGAGPHLDALRPSDGARLWSVSGGGIIADQDGILYVEKNEGIAAINDLTGATRWTWTPPAEDEFEATLVLAPASSSSRPVCVAVAADLATMASML